MVCFKCLTDREHRFLGQKVIDIRDVGSSGLVIYLGMYYYYGDYNLYLYV